MRHIVVNAQLLRHAQAALDAEADERPGRQAEPAADTPARTSRLVTTARTLGRRLRAVAARTT
jgi:hypothetical protein